MKKLVIAISVVGFFAVGAIFLFSDTCYFPLCIVKGEPPMPRVCVKEYAYLLSRAGFHQFNSMACGGQFKSGDQFVANASLPAAESTFAPTPSVASSIISANEIPVLVQRAKQGDCNAAYKLGKYNLDVTLQPQDAIGWLRIAAKCPDIEAKTFLVAALLTQQGDGKIAAEIDRTIIEMKNLDPSNVNTIRTEEEVQRRRHLRDETQ